MVLLGARYPAPAMDVRDGSNPAVGRLAAVLAVGALLPATPAAAETLVSLSTGTSFTRHGDLHLVQPGLGTDLTAHGVAWGAAPWRPAPYYGLRLTHFFARDPHWGVALDHTHYKMDARVDRVVAVDGTWRGAPVAEAVPLDRYVQRFELSHGVNVLSLSGVYRWLDPALAGGRLQPYVGAGLAHYRPHAESTVGGAAFETGYQPSGWGWQLLAGAHYRLDERWSVFAEVRLNHGTARVDIAGGHAETPLRTAHLAGGISLAF